MGNGKPDQTAFHLASDGRSVSKQKCLLNPGTNTVPRKGKCGDQQGAALVIIMTIILLGGLSLALDALLIKSKRIRGDQVSNLVLVRAKEALIAYAAMQSAKPPSPAKAYGKLPCPYEGIYRKTPDLADPLALDDYGEMDDYVENVLGTPCSSTIGFLPWKILSLPPLVDGEQAPIWYALSSDFSTGFPDKDSFICDLTITTNNVTDSGYAAILFAPGQALSGQIRASDVTAVNLIEKFLEGKNADSDIYNIYEIQNIMNNPSFNDRLLGIKCSEILKAIERL